MASKYSVLESEFETKQVLHDMAVDVLEPITRFEETIAEALNEFSSFVLYKENQLCLEILERDLSRGGGSVGELQGGTDLVSIYRVSFPHDSCDLYSYGKNDSKNVAVRLLQEFDRYQQQTKQKLKSVLTIEKIRQYMLGMCDRRSNERSSMNYIGLENLMFILSFGDTNGQVRHIDNMIPNLQICLYMSPCPSTIVYAMDNCDGLPVTNSESLLSLWARQGKSVPILIRDVLHNCSVRPLKDKWYTRYFSFWNTVDTHLYCFGKLYQPVSLQLCVQANPGTTLLAGGNEVHAGPPLTGPRMIAFAVGVPDVEGRKKQFCHTETTTFRDNNDGEVQYSPVLLHIDFCCLLFSLMDHEFANSSNAESVNDSKLFLIHILVELLRDSPQKVYLRQVCESRIGVREWLRNVLSMIECGYEVTKLIDEAIISRSIFYTPDVINRQQKRRKFRKTGHL